MSRKHNPTTESERKKSIGTLFRRVRGTLGALILLTVLMSFTVPSPVALAVSNSRWGYVWANQPSTASYAPSLPYQFNSTGAVNTVTNNSPGNYTVSFPNLGASAGTVLVTAYGSTAYTCKVVSWGPVGTTQRVNVFCFDSSGAPVNTLFTVTFTRTLSISHPLGYVWANQPSTASYTPSLPYQFNSAGVVNTITRTGIGAYRVRFPFLGASAGHVQVTAYGSGTERCKVVGWGPSGADQLVQVQCFTRTGSPIDTRYTVTYVRSASIVGSDCCAAPGTLTGYAWANQPSTASYTPSLPYQFNTAIGATNTITRLGTGNYAVRFPDQDLFKGDVQVTAYGSGSEFCKVVFWNPSTGVRVNCFDTTGAPRDTLYDVTFLRSYL